LAILQEFAQEMQVEQCVATALLQKAQETLSEDRRLQQLYDILIRPVLSYLGGADAEELLIIPDGRLSLVPWAALKDEHNHYMAEYHTLQIAPSVLVARFLETRSEHTKRGHCAARGRSVVVANPWPVHPVHGVESLKYGEEEASCVAETLRECCGEVDFVQGADATKVRVANMLMDAGWVHMACHGLLDEQALVLACDACSVVNADDESMAAQIVDNSMLSMNHVQEHVCLQHGCTVVLSACNTACGRVGVGEGVVGLARAFFSAGASALVITLWSIGDESTKQLMANFYSHLAKGLSVAHALRLAMLASLGKKPLVRPLCTDTFADKNAQNSKTFSGLPPGLREEEGGGGGGTQGGGVLKKDEKQEKILHDEEEGGGGEKEMLGRGKGKV